VRVLPHVSIRQVTKSKTPLQQANTPIVAAAGAM